MSELWCKDDWCIQEELPVIQRGMDREAGEGMRRGWEGR